MLARDRRRIFAEQLAVHKILEGVFNANPAADAACHLRCRWRKENTPTCDPRDQNLFNEGAVSDLSGRPAEAARPCCCRFPAIMSLPQERETEKHSLIFPSLRQRSVGQSLRFQEIHRCFAFVSCRTIDRSPFWEIISVLR